MEAHTIIIIAAVVAVVLSFFLMSDDMTLAMLSMVSLKGLLIIAGWVTVAVVMYKVHPSLSWLSANMAGALTVAIIAVSFIGLALWEKYSLEAEISGELAEAREQRNALEDRGVSVKGTITNAKRTGLRVNQMPQVEITFDFNLADGRTVEAKLQRLIDILDVPKVQPGVQVDVIYDPENPGNFEMYLPGEGADRPAAATGAAASAAAAGEVSGTGGTLDCPLWLFGHEDADQWVFPPRREGSPPLVLIDITDPFDASRSGDGGKIIDSAAFLMAENLWANTDLDARPAILVDVENRKLIHPVGKLSEYVELRPFLSALDYEPVVCWGAALENLDAEGIQIKIRTPEDAAERTLAGPLSELVEMLTDWLTRHNLCQRIAPPAWYRFPDPALLPAYAETLDYLQLQILGDKKNKFLDPLDPDIHHGCTGAALDLADKNAHRPDQLQHIAVTHALYAHRAGQLTSELRGRALTVIRRVTDRAHPLYRASPYLLAQFGEPMEAATRRRELLAGADPVYAAWLNKTAAL
jgi:hypothetical protein